MCMKKAGDMRHYIIKKTGGRIIRKTGSWSQLCHISSFPLPYFIYKKSNLGEVSHFLTTNYTTKIYKL